MRGSHSYEALGMGASEFRELQGFGSFRCARAPDPFVHVGGCKYGVWAGWGVWPKAAAPSLVNRY